MKDNERLARIDQKLSDFIDMYKEHRTEDAKKFETLEKVVKRVNKMEQPFKWAGAIVTASILGGCTYLGEKAIQWTLGATNAVRHLPK